MIIPIIINNIERSSILGTPTIISTNLARKADSNPVSTIR